jgi:hypothetical protein
MTDMFEALNPCTDAPAVGLVPLAVRPSTLAGLRVALVQTMPPGSGLEPIIEALRAELVAVSPTVVVAQYMRANFMMADLGEVEHVAANFDAAIVVSGPAATMVHLAVGFATELERRGTPAPLVYFEALAGSAAHSVGTVGAPLRTWSFANPPRTDDATRACAAHVVVDLTTPLTLSEAATGVRPAVTRNRIAHRGNLAEVVDYFHAEGWTDGLPIMPPTDHAVNAMLSGTSRAATDVVTESLRPEGRQLTVETVAINAVMAGARPEYLPVILAAMSVFGDVQFESMTRSVNSFAFAQLVSGPIAHQIGMNGGLGALGPGNRANATIGRTVNLLLRTAGGARAGVNVTPTQGNALGYTAAFAENEAASPWPPFHTGVGYKRDESVVSVLLGGWAHNGNFYYGDLDDVAKALQGFEIPQTGAFVLVSEKRAHLLADDGWTKERIEQYLHERATIRLGDFRSSGFWPMSRGQIEGRGPSSAPVWPKDYLTRSDDDIVAGYPPGTIKVVVVGSDVSSLIQAWKWQLHRSVPIDPWR